MRIIKSIGLALALCAASFSASHAELRHLWSRSFDSGKNEFLATMAVSVSGDVFVIATVDSVVSFGNGPVGPGIVAARLDATGAPIWSRVLVTGYGRVFDEDAAATGDGGLVVTGGVYGAVDFGGGLLAGQEITANDVFVVKLDATGAVAWQRRFGLNMEQTGNAVAVASNGDVVITGKLVGPVDFGGGLIFSSNASDMFVAKLDGNGAHVWSRGFGRNGSQEGTAVDIGPDGRVVLACKVSAGTIDFGGGLLQGAGLAVAVLDGTGAHVWSRLLGHFDSDSYPPAVNNVALDGSGNAFVCGTLGRAVDVGDNHRLIPTGQATGAVISYGPSGAYRWSQLIPDPVSSRLHTLDIDSAGNCFVVAESSGPVVIGRQTVPAARFLLIGYGPDGQPLCASAFGSPPPWSVQHLAIDGAGSILVAGGTWDAIDFGGGSLPAPEGAGFFLAKLAIRRPPDVTFTRFEAHARDVGVEVAWNLRSGEPLADYFLRRRADEETNVYTVTSGIAADGEQTFLDHTTQPGHVYTYELAVSTALGDEAFSPTVSVKVPTVANVLRQNSPNPFNPLTTIAYSLAGPAAVKISIFDISGALVATLDQGTQPAGTHEATWGGHDNQGRLVASGVYFYRLEGVAGMGPRKMVLLK